MRLARIALLLFAVGAAAQDPAPPTFEEQVQELEAEIARVTKVDVKHPDYFEARLSYAQLLARNAVDALCAPRLAAAESHFKEVAGNPLAMAVMPTAKGRIAGVRYSIEMARARCATDDAAKKASFNAALAAAKASVEGYRASFHYEAMTFMQFNVAQAHREIGNDAEASRQLEAAIAMDRTFGLKSDGEENFRALKQWQGGEATDAEVEEFRKAPRTSKLTFAWTPTRLEANVAMDMMSYEDGVIKQSKVTMPVTGSVKTTSDGFLYEVKAGEPKVEGSGLSSDVEKKIAGLMARIFGQIPVAEIAKDGTFKGVKDIAGFTKRVADELDSAVKESVPKDDPRLPAIQAAVKESVDDVLTPDVLQAKFQESYGLETGIWVDAQLDHNVWMEMPLTLSMNGTPQGFLKYRAEFVLARWLPCADGMAANGCVEIVMEAIPDKEALATVAENLDKAGNGKLDYTATTRLRVVVDPATLRPYESEVLEYSYLALADEKQRAVQIETERTQSRYQYRK